MAIIVDETTRILVQGITGREGRARTKLMREFGAQVVAGVTPGKGGQDVEGVPVFDSVAEAIEAVGPVDVSVCFVPAQLVKGAALEALEAGVPRLLLVPDRVPLWDAMAIAARARELGADFIGPNTLGVLSPGRACIGMIGGSAASARAWFPQGPVGIVSRSGGMTSSTGYYLGREGVGLSTLAHVGGDAVLGLRIPDVALLFEQDPQTELIAVFGEIGGSQEEDLAALIREGAVTKPVVAYIGGKAAREGARFSHAGAIIEQGRGTRDAKVAALQEAGACVVDAFGDLPAAVKERLR